jgi:hypothetical protein
MKLLVALALCTFVWLQLPAEAPRWLSLAIGWLTWGLLLAFFLS